MSGRTASSRLSKTEREILAVLDPDEAALGLVRTQLRDPLSAGLLVVTDRRVIFRGGRVWRYAAPTAGAMIAEMIAERRRVERIIPLERVSVWEAAPGWRSSGLFLRDQDVTLSFTKMAKAESEAFRSALNTAINKLHR